MISKMLMSAGLSAALLAVPVSASYAGGALV